MVKEKVLALSTKVRENANKVAVGGLVTATTMLSTIAPAFASETPAAGSSVIDATLKTAITAGANNLLATVTDVIGVTIPVTITAVGIVIGCKFALKQLKGVLSHAA